MSQRLKAAERLRRAEETVNRHGLLAVAAVGLCAALWTYACGDGATEPAAPAPDPPRPTTVTVGPATARLTALGETVQLTAEVRDQNGQVMAGAAVNWASSAAAVATAGATGLVTAAGNGTAAITATAGSASGSATVTVAQEVSTVTVTPAADTVVAGDTLRLPAEAADGNGHLVAGAEFDWMSSDTLVALVDDGGLVTGVGAGEAEVMATAMGVTGRAALTVLAPMPAAVAVTPDTLTLTALGQTAQLAAEVRDRIGRVMHDVPVSWSSADTTVAAVDSAGLATAVGGGATTIAAMAGEVSGTAVVTVMQSAGSVVVSPAADTVAPGDTLRLGAEAFDENGHPVAGAEFAWSSGNASVATVDASGLVRGTGEGAATITATAGDARGTSEITVENPDRAALVALYNATNGPSWINNDNWLTDAPLGEWHGVDTDASGRVVRLELSGWWDSETGRNVQYGLLGTIPHEIGTLTNLESLDLQNNSLTGPIPAEIAKLASLTTLDLGYNSLRGPIPAEIGNLSSLRRLVLEINNHTGPIPPELGSLTALRSLRLGYNELSGSIPVELGGLSRLINLSLPGNQLTGAIPTELGNLTALLQLSLDSNELSGPIPLRLGSLSRLQVLSLGYNQLTGAIPESFLGVDGLWHFSFGGNAGLCAPGTADFVTWLDAIEGRGDGLYCNASDTDVLEALYEVSGGPDWTNSDGWLGIPALAQWHGVTADSLGRVVTLDLTRNGLAGRLPQNLGALAGLTGLRIGDNALSGRLPSTLSRLSLVELHYPGTDLCAPSDDAFRTWLGGIASHEGTGVECAPLSDRDILEIFYDATGGPDWTNDDNWLTDAPLREWYGVHADGQDRVVSLSLYTNNLTGTIPPELGGLANLIALGLNNNALSGPIPPELGDLADLQRLGLYLNDLSGPIPAELGSLANLKMLSLGDNNLTGPIPAEFGNLDNLEQLFIGDGNAYNAPIPPELGSLTNLQRLSMRNAQVTGRIPPELGNLASLTHVWLFGNELTGPIPPEIGNLARLENAYLGDNRLSGEIPPELAGLDNIEDLYLNGNELTGPLPPELGNLSTLEALVISGNALTGSVPPAFGGMSSLKQLALTNNPGMAGALPSRLVDLRQLEDLLVGGTDLCAPSDPDFQAWLDGVHKRRIAPCAEGEPPAAYLTQAVQSREFPVPLVAGERALLRVFVTARQATSEGIPVVRARFFRNGREIHVADIPGKSGSIPTEVDESSLSMSANAEIPGHVIQPGLEMVIEVDPEETLDPDLGVARRIPGEGRLAVDVRAMPLFDLTLIPFIWTETHDSSIVDLVEAMAADPQNHEMLRDTRTLLPVADLDVTAHEPVLSSSNSAFRLLDQTKAIRAMEGGTGHYKGMMSRPITDAGGIAELPGRSSFSTPRGSTLAHELGHNLNLQHAPCAVVGDPSYPYPDGSIGVWGYDFRDGGSLVLPSRPDLMSYCFQAQWIGDYSFTNALRYRLFDEGAPAVAAATRSLLLWGGVDADSVPYLEPAFAVEAPAALPDSAGEYHIFGRTETGTQLFALGFAMPETADGDGSSSFAFVLPVRPGWEDGLHSITLTGPGGSDTVDVDSDRPMAILRNPRTGQIRGILRDPPPATRTVADGRAAGAPDPDILFSRGIPSRDAWRR